jgi:hypothetical protein
LFKITPTPSIDMFVVPTNSFGLLYGLLLACRSADRGLRLGRASALLDPRLRRRVSGPWAFATGRSRRGRLGGTGTRRGRLIGSGRATRRSGDAELTDATMRAQGRPKSAKVLTRYAKRIVRQFAKGIQKPHAEQSEKRTNFRNEQQQQFVIEDGLCLPH